MLLQRNQRKGEGGKGSKIKDERRNSRGSERGEGKIMDGSGTERLHFLLSKSLLLL